MRNTAQTDADQPARLSWVRRNWRWIVPVGCLIPVITCGGVGLIGLIVVAIPAALRSSDAYQEAVANAKKNETVQAALGAPIEEGFFVTGNIHVSGTSGKADLAIPLKGPKGAATVYAVAQKQAGRWTFSLLEVAVDGGDRINLLSKK